MKKILTTLVCITVLLCMFSCDAPVLLDNGKLDIVCTSFAQYDWVKNIIKDTENVNLVLLNTKGTDIHSFEPSADDIIKVSQSDILVIIGSQGDEWAVDAVSDTQKTSVINLIEIVENGEFNGETLEHTHTDECDHEHTHSLHATDEHVWMSLKNAQLFVYEIADAICKKDSENAQVYSANTENYVNQLRKLDDEFEKAVDSAEKPVMVVADRFPFTHLTNDYAITCFAAFPGCSADTDASPDTIIKLSKAVDEYGLASVAVTENTSGKTSKAVIENTAQKNQKTVVIDSMQAVSQKDIENGVTYLQTMEKNLEAIKTLLEVK